MGIPPSCIHGDPNWNMALTVAYLFIEVWQAEMKTLVHNTEDFAILNNLQNQESIFCGCEDLRLIIWHAMFENILDLQICTSHTPLSDIEPDILMWYFLQVTITSVASMPPDKQMQCQCESDICTYAGHTIYEDD